MDKFLEYAKAYDQTNGKVKLKILHTEQVTRVMDELTKRLGLPEHMRKLAHVCAVYHDIGRFEQIRQYGTFNDLTSVDHADLSCEVLKQGAFLQKLSAEDQQMILTAIENHNKYAIADGLDEDTVLLSKLIRDADKLDIFRVFASEDMIDTMGQTIEEVRTQKISDNVFQTMMEHQCIDRSKRKTGMDKWVNFLSFCYDMNFSESFQIMREEGYYRRQFDQTTFADHETQKRVQLILEELEQYIDERLMKKAHITN